MSDRNRVRWVWAGPAAFAWFFGWVLGLAALRPEYHHATKAISELGAVGAPYMLAMNAFGFVGTGVCLALFAVGYRARMGERAVGYKSIMLTALLFMMTAVPMEMGADGDPDMGSKLTRLHLVFVMLAPIPWLWALIGIARRYVDGTPRALALASAAAFLGVVGVTIFLMADRTFQAPGLVQRASFVLFLGWFAAAPYLMRNQIESRSELEKHRG
ncbi:DUF998 domain-containing protein [Mesorhizobium sp.]|jgi:hypothetical membrane protein|uniref:DUF998 domain-containing protein n=1 Tax=Mesorhizobium sp. TaxID=1871066 RepID=UPI0035613293